MKTPCRLHAVTCCTPPLPGGVQQGTITVTVVIPIIVTVVTPIIFVSKTVIAIDAC